MTPYESWLSKLKKGDKVSYLVGDRPFTSTVHRFTPTQVVLVDRTRFYGAYQASRAGYRVGSSSTRLLESDDDAVLVALIKGAAANYHALLDEAVLDARRHRIDLVDLPEVVAELTAQVQKIIGGLRAQLDEKAALRRRDERTKA